jgi:hypothetical protein
VVNESNVETVRRIVTVSDAEGYTKRRDDEQRDLQNRMVGIQEQAARNARLDRQQAHIQPAGDGDLTAWPWGTCELDLIANYVRELACELDRVNRSLSESSRIRLRFAISAGLVEVAAQGITGQAAIKASLLANSDQLRQALRDYPQASLAVILDDKLFEDVVASGRRGLQSEAYRRVVVKDKYKKEHVAWITVFRSGRPGAFDTSDDSAQGGAASEPARKWWPRLPIPIIVALIGAVGAICAATITAPHPSDPPSLDPSSSSGAGSASAAASASSTVADPTSSPRLSQGKLHWEMTDNRLGTDVFRDPMGDVVMSGPVSIPYHTWILVKCWAPNDSGMGSINVFYLVETPPWAGEYAPANTFLNADTTGALDPNVRQCLGDVS